MLADFWFDALHTPGGGTWAGWLLRAVIVAITVTLGTWYVPSLFAYEIPAALAVALGVGAAAAYLVAHARQRKR